MLNVCKIMFSTKFKFKKSEYHHRWNENLSLLSESEFGRHAPDECSQACKWDAARLASIRRNGGTIAIAALIDECEKQSNQNDAIY